MGLALALACGLHYRRCNPVVWLIAGAAPLLIALVAFNAAFYGDPLGVHIRANLDPADAMARPLTEMARRIVSVLAGQGASPRETALLGAAVVLAWLLGWLGARRTGPLRQAAWVALALGLTAWAWPLVGALGGAAPLRQLVDYNGLLVRVPLAAAAGIGLWHLRAPDYASLRLGVGSGLGFIALTLAAGVFTHSQLGAGVHWGPRTLLPALPALVALFIVALRGDPNAQPRSALRWAGAALVTAGLFSSGQSAWLLYHQKADAERLQTAILSAPPQIIVTSHPMLALHLAPIWPYKPMLRLLDKPSLDRLARRLRLDGIGDLLLLTPPGSPEVSTSGGLRCQIVARPRGRLHYLDMDLQTCRLVGN
jgi:hypothetical protein